MRKNKKDIKLDLITTELLDKYYFHNSEICMFDGFKDMGYYVKNGICLFYNKPLTELNYRSFYVGYATMINGKYIAVGFRWIDKIKDLKEIYESITMKMIEEINLLYY